MKIGRIEPEPRWCSSTKQKANWIMWIVNCFQSTVIQLYSFKYIYTYIQHDFRSIYGDKNDVGFLQLEKEKRSIETENKWFNSITVTIWLLESRARIIFI